MTNDNDNEESKTALHGPLRVGGGLEVIAN